MDILKWTEKAMLMDDKTWSRHANPYSVYSRFSTLPLISFAFYSREWLGLYSLGFIALSLLWVWLNPRLFSPPAKTNNWASMATFGERVYLDRENVVIPLHHLQMCRVLQCLSAMGLPFFLYGLYSLDLWALIFGNVWIMTFKAWFVDRMVWLYLDVKDADPKYQSWLKI